MIEGLALPHLRELCCPTRVIQHRGSAEQVESLVPRMWTYPIASWLVPSNCLPFMLRLTPLALRLSRLTRVELGVHPSILPCRVATYTYCNDDNNNGDDVVLDDIYVFA